MSAQWIAINASVFGVFFILFIHSWISILFLLNKIKSSEYLQKYMSNYEKINNLFPYNEILDFVITKEENCPDGYYDLNLFHWNGFIEGMTISEKTYDKRCYFNECRSRDYKFFTKTNCKNSNEGTQCCDYKIDTPNSFECQDIEINDKTVCKCPFTVLRKNDYKNNPADREIGLIPSINSRTINNIKNKFCFKKIKFDFSNKGKCENMNKQELINYNSTLCFDNYCLQNVTNCPNYSSFLRDFGKEIDFSINDFPLNKPIFDFSFKYNTYACSPIKIKDYINDGDSNEFKFILNNITQKDIEVNQGCYSNVVNGSRSMKDIFEIFEINSMDFYKKVGIFQSINEIYVDPLLLNKLSLSNYINDKLIFTIKSDLDIDYEYDYQTCKTDFIKNINIAVQATDYILNSNINLISIFTNIFFVIIICGICIYFFISIKKLYRESHHIFIFRLVLFTNLLFFIYNLTIYFVFKKDINFIVGIESLNQYTNCFKERNVRDFLDNINDGLSIYKEAYNTSLKKILIENSVTFLLLISLIIPISLIKKILYID